MKSGGIAPTAFDSMLSHTAFKMRNPDQRQVWDKVNTTTTMMAQSSELLDRNYGMSSNIETERGAIETLKSEPIDDLKGCLDLFSKQIEEVLRKIPYFENQTGMAILDLTGVASLECFDLSLSWKALRDDIIKKEGENLSKLQKESPFEYKEGKAVRSVKELLNYGWEEKITFKTQEVKIIALNSEKFTGEITEYNGELLHLILVRK